MGKPNETKDKPSTGSSKRFWADQILEGLKQYPSVARPSIPKLGQSIYNPKDANFSQFHMKYPVVTPIMQVKYAPNIGTPEGFADPSNLDGVFSNIIATMRQKCTTAYNYDQGSLAAAIMGAGSVPYLLAHVKRRLRAMYTNNLGSNLSADDIWAAFSDGEWAISPDKALNFKDLDSIVGKYNDIVDVYNSIAPPNFFPVFRRWEEMESEVFRDINDDPHGCAQLYYFSADGYYFPKESTDPTNPGFILQWRSYTGDLVGELNTIYDLVKTLQNNQDMVQIYGDICKTYGDERYKIDKLSDDYHEIKEGLSTVYDPTINFALYHATLFPVTPGDVFVKATTGRLVGGLDFTNEVKSGNAAYKAWQQILKMPKLINAQQFDEPIDNLVEWCQWTVCDTQYHVNGAIVNVGTDVLTAIRMWTYKIENGVRVLTPLDVNSNFRPIAVTADDYADDHVNIDVEDQRRRSIIQQFAYHPITYYTYVEFDNNFTNVFATHLEGTDAELEYPSFITAPVLEQWHDAMRYRLWGLPHLVQLEADGKAKAYWN